MHEGVQCRNWDEVEVHINALQSRFSEIERRIRYVEKQLDTLGSPWWRKLWFRIDGWPPWWVIAQKRSWRPWHR